MKKLNRRLAGCLGLLVFGALLAACAGNPTYTVNSTNDLYDGACNASHCSLREAIILALAHSGVATIKFNIGGGGHQTIQPTSALPAITKPMIIDGRTQPGYTNAPLIEIDGSLAGAGISGLRLEGGGSTITSLIINNFNGNGIHLLAPGGNEIYSNYIGTDAAGTAARPNGENGILVESGDSNHIGGLGGIGGGPLFGLGNVISGNAASGVVFSSGGKNHLEGNAIGLDATGNAPLGNGLNGVLVDTDLLDIQGNYISGNIADGVRIRGAWTVSMENNWIGTDRLGTAAVGNQANGVNVIGSSEITIGGDAAGKRNWISGNGLVGIRIDAGSDQVAVLNNYVGTDLSGTAALKNIKSGIVVDGTNHQIGSPGKGNLVSGNGGAGIAVLSTATGIVIQSNYIGTVAGGMAALGNDAGIEVGVGAGNTQVKIGGAALAPEPREGNLISGNLEDGIRLFTGASVWGNLIGTDATGTGPLGNGGNGILVKGSGNQIGGPASENTIAFNGGHGVAVISESGSAVHNAIQVNSIHDNVGLGIALGGNSVLPNDNLDSDVGDNGLQNYPVLKSAVADTAAGTTTIDAALDSKPNTAYSVEFFSSAACDPSGYGEGQSMFNHIMVTTDAGGHADIHVVQMTTSFLFGNNFTLTATDPAGNTSGFSNCIAMTTAAKGGGGGTATPGLPLTFEPFVNPLELFIGACGVNEALITVQIDNPPAPIGYVLLFGRLAEKATFAKSPWMDAVAMAPEANSRWSYSLSVYDLPENKTHVDAWLQYQFVVYDAAQNEIGRSDVFGNISVKRCRSLSSAG